MHNICYSEWSRERMSLSRPFSTINPSTTALVVVDLQNGFLLDESPFSIPQAIGIIPGVNALAAATREAGGEVVFLRQTTSDDPRYAFPDWVQENRPRLAASADIFRPGHKYHSLHRDVDVRDQDIVVDKHRYSAMPHTSSDLDALLRDMAIDTLIITGVATHCCCESTARDAFMLNYKVIFISDATATYNDDLQSGSLANLGMLFCDIRDTSSAIDLLEARVISEGRASA